MNCYSRMLTGFSREQRVSEGGVMLDIIRFSAFSKLCSSFVLSANESCSI